MRNQALQNGFTLNEHGLYKMEAKKKGDKVNKIFINEKDIFKYLKIEYKEPKDRIDGRAVVNKDNNENNKESINKDKENNKENIIEDNIEDNKENINKKREIVIKETNSEESIIPVKKYLKNIQINDANAFI
jgi:hypothetical protein